MRNENEADFTVFVRSAEPQLRQALVAAFGADLGRDAAAEALAWGWQNWDRLSDMVNPTGYLYRVGRTHGLREIDHAERPGIDVVESTWVMPDFEPALAKFLATLSESQRVCVWMVRALGYAQTEVAELLGCSPESVATHIRRALQKLRAGLEVDTDV